MRSRTSVSLNKRTRCFMNVAQTSQIARAVHTVCRTEAVLTLHSETRECVNHTLYVRLSALSALSAGLTLCDVQFCFVLLMMFNAKICIAIAYYLVLVV